jgi:hypothetical protein
MKAYKNRLLLLAVAGASVAATSPAAAQEALPPAEQVIERYVDALGGRDAVLRHQSVRITGTFSMPAAGIQGDMVMKSAAPDLSIVQIEIPGLGTILSGYDGAHAWSVDPNLGPRLLQGKELAAAREGAQYLAAVRDPSLFKVRETVELTEMNGQPCYKVRLVWNSDRETFDCYSVETGLLIAGIARQESPMGAIDVVTLLEDYREVNGTLSAMRMRQQMLGQEQVMTLDTVEHDVVDPSAFAPPETIRTLIEQNDG